MTEYRQGLPFEIIKNMDELARLLAQGTHYTTGETYKYILELINNIWEEKIT